MNFRRRIPTFFALAGILAGCAAATADLTLHLDGRDINLRKFLREHALPNDQDTRVDLIATGPTTSIHVVQLRHGERPHMHAAHALRVVVIRGRGTMVLDRKKVPAGVGSVFEIKRGAGHYFLNKSKIPAAALVTFTPPYDGKDLIPVPAD